MVRRFLMLILIILSTARQKDGCKNSASTLDSNNGIQEKPIHGKRAPDCDLVVIGVGAQGTGLLAQFAKKIKLKKGKKFHITFVEEGFKFGPGLAYDEDVVTDAHLLNLFLAAQIDIVDAAKPFDSMSWLRKWISRHPGKTYSWRDLFRQMVVPFTRAVAGNYLIDRFHEFVNTTIKKGYEITLMSSTTALNVTKEGSHFVVKLSHGADIHTTDIFLATGHWSNSRFTEFVEGYFSSPWPASLLRNNITENHLVGIFGTSLSAIDVALTVADMFGHFLPDKEYGWIYNCPDSNKFAMVMYSRSGYLPAVQGAEPMRVYIGFKEHNKDVEALRKGNNGFLPLDDVFEIIKKDFADVEKSRASGYKDLEPYVTKSEEYWNLGPEALLDFIYRRIYFDETDSVQRLRFDIKRSRKSYKSGFRPTAKAFCFRLIFFFNTNAKYLSAEDTKRFREGILPKLLKHTSIPLQNAEKMMALIRTGRLSLVAAKNADVTPGPGNVGVNVTYDNDTETVNVFHRYFIDALGQSGDIEKDPRELTKSLLQNGLVEPHFVPFRKESEAKELEKTQPHKVKLGSDGKFYYKSVGAQMDPDSNRVYPLGEESGTGGVIYASGPFIYGYAPHAQAFSVVRDTSQRVANDIKQRHKGTFS